MESRLEKATLRNRLDTHVGCFGYTPTLAPRRRIQQRMRLSNVSMKQRYVPLPIYITIPLTLTQEFYPTPPESSLELSWADILNPDEIPPDLVDKTVKIPFLILHELFTPVVEDRPRAVWKKKARMKFVRGRGYPGKVVSSDVEEPGSEVSLPDLEGSDATYVGGVGGLEVECGGVVTRSMARGE